jgi:hypothetical protein
MGLAVSLWADLSVSVSPDPYVVQVLKVLAKIMNECWFEDSQSRLTALRIKKTLLKLYGTEVKADAP